MSKKWSVLPYTPHNRMVFRALIRMAGDWYEELAEKRGMPVAIIDEAITDYAMLCARSKGLNGHIDFKITTPNDTPKIMNANFVVYLDSECMDVLRKVEQAIMAYEKVADDDLAPNAKPEGEV